MTTPANAFEIYAKGAQNMRHPWQDSLDKIHASQTKAHDDIVRLREINAELLAALEAILPYYAGDSSRDKAPRQARAAIRKARGE